MKSFLLVVATLLFAFSLLADVAIEVESVVFEGNKLISTRDLLEQILTTAGSEFSLQRAQEDSANLADYYLSKGHYNVRIEYPEAIPVSPLKVKVIFRIFEGEDYDIQTLNLSGNSYFSEERIFQLTGLRENGSYPVSTVDNILFRIVDLYAARGFLFAKANLDSLSIAEEGLAAYITIDEGRFCRFENFVFEGNDTTREKTILRISGLDQLETFGLNQLQQAEENVRRKEYVRDFSLIPLNHQTLLLSLQEDRMTHVSGLLGYDSSQKDSANRLTGFINLRFLNLYGTDRSFAFSWRRMRADRQYVEFKYHESGPFNYPVAGDLLIFRETVESTYIKTTADLDVYYYTLRNKTGIYLGLDDFFPGSRRPIIVERASQRKIGLFWDYNSEDYYLNPTRGMNSSIRHYFIFSKDEDQRINKQATEIRWANYSSVMPRFVLMVSLNGKQVENKKLKDYELYTLGGMQDLRGFREDQFSGFRIGWSNIEMRYLLTRRSRFFVFADYGFVQMPDGEETKTIKDLFGVGLGLRVDTRIGLIGIDYGFSYSQGK